MNNIKGFQGQYRFLSNFYPNEIDFNGCHFLSSEAAYQAMKTSDPSIQNQFTKLTAREARTLGKQIQIRSDWESEKLNVMYKLLRIKFSKDPLKRMLINTEDAYLEETNYWHDIFWGVYNGNGENHLGKLLMLIRDELKEKII